jgi:hypothetical protein
MKPASGGGGHTILVSVMGADGVVSECLEERKCIMSWLSEFIIMYMQESCKFIQANRIDVLL